jgi:hypothetical protein
VSSGICALLRAPRIPVSKVLLERRQRRLLRPQRGIDHGMMSQRGGHGTVALRHGEPRTGRGEAVGGLSIPTGIDEGVERHAGACHPIAAVTVLHRGWRCHGLVCPPLLPLLCLRGTCWVWRALVASGQPSGGLAGVSPQLPAAPWSTAHGAIPSLMAIGRRPAHRPPHAVRKGGAVIKGVHLAAQRWSAPCAPQNPP